MVEKSRDVQRRLSVLMDLWNRIIDAWESNENLTRERVIDLLKQAYAEEKITPLKGASTPEDLYDKEMTSLYIVGKYGMGLEELYPKLFDTLFPNEIRYDKAIKILLSEEPEKAKDKIVALMGGRLDDNTVARMFRLKFTEIYFGFSDEKALAELLKAFIKAFPEKERIAVKYARFYIAFKVAASIYRGEVRDRITKEALKQASALAFSELQGSIPDDSYIEKIATGVFGVRRNNLRHILAGGRKAKKK
ncbi:MAG: DUF2192 domain-containing protein [Desulfurococcales archaeon]|nr:DUF2192 domain-containing protein [Desulfurococcales archaeon]